MLNNMKQKKWSYISNFDDHDDDDDDVDDNDVC